MCLGAASGHAQAHLDGFKARALRSDPAAATRHLYATEWRPLKETAARTEKEEAEALEEEEAKNAHALRLLNLMLTPPEVAEGEEEDEMGTGVASGLWHRSVPTARPSALASGCCPLT